MTNNFLWHEVTEKEKEEIKSQAKAIMENFSNQLSAVKTKISEPLIERESCERQEGNSSNDESFDRQTMFENAPQSRDDFILAEKKSW